MIYDILYILPVLFVAGAVTSILNTATPINVVPVEWDIFYIFSSSVILAYLYLSYFGARRIFLVLSDKKYDFWDAFDLELLLWIPISLSLPFLSKLY